jgi:hypothetical protein
MTDLLARTSTRSRCTCKAAGADTEIVQYKAPDTLMRFPQTLKLCADFAGFHNSPP